MTIDGGISDRPAPQGDGDAAPASPAPRRRGWRILRVALATIALVVVAAIVASIVKIPYYAITPGSGIPVSSLITVPQGESHGHLGGVLLTDVELIQLNALSYLYYRFNSNDEVLAASALVGSASNAQYEQQGVIDMYNARQAATVVGLDQLGYKAKAVPSGVIVYQPERNGGGSAGLTIGAVIDSLNGTKIRLIAGLVSALGERRPGTWVTLGLRGLFTHKASSLRIRLGEVRIAGTGSNATETCAVVGTETSLQPLMVHGQPAACLGIAPEQAYTLTGEPFPVSISDDNISGPSAGLAFTLGLIEKLDRSDLTAGLKVAATGTMSVTGQVGDVGGVAQKTIAVRAAGAAVFFVPPGEYHTALANAGPSLKVLAVSTIGQAIADLEQLGGRLTPTAGQR